MKRSRDAEDEDDSSGYGEQVAMVPIYKILNLDTEESNPESNAIQCSLPGHAKGMSFVDYHDYERHYVQAHTNRCVECSRNFPTSHILGLHIQEFHDALAEMQREQGAYTYACFMGPCQDKFNSHNQRKEHLIKDHGYPHSYFFAVTKFGIDRRQSMLVEHRRAKSSQSKDSRPEEQRSKNHGIKPAGQSCDTGASKDVPMTDVERPTNGQQDAAEDVPMIKAGQSAAMESRRDLTAGEARKSPTATPSEMQSNQDSAAGDVEMKSLTSAMSSLIFVPRAIRLGPKQKARP